MEELSIFDIILDENNFDNIVLYDEKNGIVFCLSFPFGGFGFLRPQSARRQTARPVAVRKYIARRRGRRRGIFPAQENQVWEIRRCRFQIG